MAFKMKGFPLRSGFAHTGGGASHEDHHKSEISPNENESGNMGGNEKTQEWFQGQQESLKNAIAGRDQLQNYMNDPGFKHFDQDIKDRHHEGIARFNAEIERIQGLIDKYKNQFS